jgi:hypothetical protein
MQRRVSNKNLLINHGSRIMGVRVCEGLLPCPPVLLMVSNGNDNNGEKEIFSDHKHVHLNLVVVTGDVACVFDVAVM